MSQKLTNEDLIKIIFKNEDELKNIYGDKYYDILIKQYQLYLDITERLGTRRDVQNNFFLAIHTLIVSGIGYCIFNISNSFYFPILLSLLGLFFASLWQRLINSYRILKSVAYRLITLAESKMPASGYDAEYRLLEEEKHIPFTEIEIKIPLCFSIAYFILFYIILYQRLTSQNILLGF